MVSILLPSQHHPLTPPPALDVSINESRSGQRSSLPPSPTNPRAHNRARGALPRQHRLQRTPEHDCLLGGLTSGRHHLQRATTISGEPPSAPSRFGALLFATTPSSEPPSAQSRLGDFLFATRPSARSPLQHQRNKLDEAGPHDPFIIKGGRPVGPERDYRSR